MRVLIVGGGAAGLCCAIRLRQLDPALQVTVLERLEQPGKKLLATGNGRCNLTNMQAPHSRAVLDFFASLGLMTRQEDLGRVYPYSLRAATVQNLLLDACRTLGVRLVTGCRVEKILSGFTVQTDKGVWWWPAAGRHSRHWAAMAAAMPCCRIWVTAVRPCIRRWCS